MEIYIILCKTKLCLNFGLHIKLLLVQPYIIMKYISFLLFVVKCVNVIARISVKNYDTMGIYQN